MRLNFEKKHAILFLLLKTFIVMFLCFVFSIKMSGITKEIFRVPMVPTGWDSNLMYLFEKNMLESGNVFFNDRLGAPFSGELYDFPVAGTLNFDLLVLRLLLFLCPDIFVALNIYYVILPMFIGVITFFVLRSLGTSDWINMGGAIVYAFLPFYFMRNLGHFGLTTYQFVPLTFLLCVWGYQGKIFSKLTKRELLGNYRNWISVFFCLLIANNGNAYWQAFSCFFLLVTGLLVVNDTKKWNSALSCLFPISLIVLFFIMALYPVINYRMIYGKNIETVQRISIEPDIYGLKMSQMLIPYEIPGNSDQEIKFKNYLDTAPLTNENRSSYLGFIGSIGFLLLLFYLLLARKHSNEMLDLFARLNISGFLLATIGGVGTIIAVFISPITFLRAYNRISVYIAFLGVAAVCLSIHKRLENVQGRKYRAYQIGFCFLIIVHFILLYSGFHGRPDYKTLKKYFQSDQQFVAAIEASLPIGSMIYQFPYHKFPEGGCPNKMFDYQLLTGVLHSQQLKWSYGAMKGRAGDKWHAWVASLPLDKRLKMLSLTGFQGVYVERRAYKQKELEELEAELVSLLKVNPMESEDKNLAFFPMNNYNDSYLSKYTHEEIHKLHDDLLSRGNKFNVKGVSFIEKDSHGNTWRWMDKNVKIDFEYHGKPYDKEIKLSVAAGASSEANLKVVINGNLFTYKIYNEPNSIVIPAHFRHGKNTIELYTDADKVNAPKDKRSMYMRLINCDINEENLLPSLAIK